MLILGIDPGTARTGFGIIKIFQNKPRLVKYGCVTTPKEMPSDRRLKSIFNQTVSIINKYHPEVLAIERLFFNRNAKTVTEVNRATGVIILAAAKARIPVHEYMPLQIKAVIDGYGRANKKQIQKRVVEFLQLDDIPKPDDAADALAVAICHHLKICDKLKKKGGEKNG